MITLTTVAFSTVFSVLAGLRVRDDALPGRDVLFYMFLFGLLMPFEATVIPLYFDFRQIGLTDTVWGVILPSTALSIAFGTFWMRAFFLSAPRSLMEAARIDGASSLGVLLRVLVPYGRPAILTMVVLVFMWTWNDFLLSLVMLSGQNILTAPLSLGVLPVPAHGGGPARSRQRRSSSRSRCSSCTSSSSATSSAAWSPGR